MSRPVQDGGPAFPVDALQSSVAGNGMSLRDYFAGQALMGLVIDPEFGSDEEKCTNVGIAAYLLADAMIKARGEQS